MKHLHDCNVVHSDLKAANIMFKSRRDHAATATATASAPSPHPFPPLFSHFSVETPEEGEDGVNSCGVPPPPPLLEATRIRGECMPK